MSYFNGQRIDEPSDAEMRAYREEGRRITAESAGISVSVGWPGDEAQCSIYGCAEIGTGYVRDVNSPKYGDPRCEEHAVTFTGSPTQHPHDCACASCSTSDLNETDL